MKLHPSFESFNYMPGSKLARGLVNIFEEVKEFPLKQPSTDNFNNLWEATLTFFEKTSIPKIQKLAKDELGIIVDQIICRDLYVEGVVPTACFSIQRTEKRIKGKNVWFSSTKDIIQGSGHRDNVMAETSDKLIKLMASLDQQTGKFKISDNMEENLTCNLVIDLASIVFTDVILHTKVQPLTAEEAAACLIHEFGHPISEISYMKYTHYSITILRDAFTHFRNYASLPEKVKFLKTNPFATKDFKDLIPDTTVQKGVLELADKVANLPEFKEYSALDTGAFLLSRIVDFLLNIVIETIIIPFTLLQYMSSFSIRESLLNAPNKAGARTKDFSCVGRQAIELERLADEFVTFHGMGSYSMMVDKKLQAIVDFSIGAGLGAFKYDGYSRNSNLVFGLSNFIGAMYNSFGDRTVAAYLHHPFLADRAQFLLRFQIQRIKENIHNPKLFKLAIEEYEKMLEISKDKTMSMKVDKMVKAIMNTIASLSGLITLGFINMNQRKQIEELIDAAEDIMHNDIFIVSDNIKVKFLGKG